MQLLVSEDHPYYPITKLFLIDDTVYVHAFSPEMGGWIPMFPYGESQKPKRRKNWIGHKKENIPADLRWQVWERDNFTCKQCGGRTHLTADHVVPESRGGSTALDNLQTLCRSCNSAKGNR